MRIIVDTCVWVAAVRSRRGASFALLSEIVLGRFQFGISVALFLEYQEQLLKTVENKDTPLSHNQMEAILAALVHFGTEVPIYFRLRPNLKDENDNMVFECAANFNAKKIVTLNTRDFLQTELSKFEIDPILPGAFLHAIRSTT